VVTCAVVGNKIIPSIALRWFGSVDGSAVGECQKVPSVVSCQRSVYEHVSVVNIRFQIGGDEETATFILQSDGVFLYKIMLLPKYL
jgi:hypothetical protein